MGDILFEVLKAVLVLVVILIGRYAVPYLKTRLADSQYAWVVKWVEVAVNATEQTVFGDKRGAERKAIVTQFIKEMLTDKNIALSDYQIEQLIEAAVHTMNSGKEE